MTYKSGESAALTLIRTLGEWDVNNSVSLANDANNSGITLINNGQSDHYCLLGPGGFERGWENIGDTFVLTRWETVITLAVFVPDDGESVESRLTTYRDNLIGVLDTYFQLNTTGVSTALVVRGDGIVPYQLGDGRLFITEELILLWEEEADRTQND